MRAAILHPGAMGVAVAQTMVNSGVDVRWVSNGRSPATHARAAAAGLTAVASLDELCVGVETIVSVCPPHAAEEVAAAVIDAGFAGLYIDANAISPQKSRRIGHEMNTAGLDFVDGSIVGGPPTRPGTTWLHLAGPRAAEAAALFAAGPLETNVLGDGIGRASALKMCFAAHTKGMTALLGTILGAAAEMGVLEDLETQWGRYDPEFPGSTRERVIRNAHQKAWRFVGEMEEMVETYAAAGLPSGFFAAAAEVYRRVGHFKDWPEPPDLDHLLESLKNDKMR